MILHILKIINDSSDPEETGKSFGVISEPDPDYSEIATKMDLYEQKLRQATLEKLMVCLLCKL